MAKMMRRHIGTAYLSHSVGQEIPLQKDL